MPESVTDATKQTPQTTYGVTKAACELLINDYTRKGYLDGRAARLPTIIIRPGRPNLAASSFVSGVFREPLNGEPCIVPVGPATRMPVLGYRSVVEGFLRLHDIPGVDLGHDRAVNFPSLSATVAEMIATLERVAGGSRWARSRSSPIPPSRQSSRPGRSRPASSAQPPSACGGRSRWMTSSRLISRTSCRPDGGEDGRGEARPVCYQDFPDALSPTDLQDN